MKKSVQLVFLSVAVFSVFFYSFSFFVSKAEPEASVGDIFTGADSSLKESLPETISLKDGGKMTEGEAKTSYGEEGGPKTVWALPLDSSEKRITKKTFGMFIDPETSPVQPDRFRGFHTGVDFEIFPEEKEKEVAVRAVCSGKLRLKKNATGYGGVAVQECLAEGEAISVVYGHLKLDSVVFEAGEKIRAGEVIGVLGEGGTFETGWTRKHLHLGIHRGKQIELKGYVKNREELSAWIDPCFYLCS